MSCEICGDEKCNGDTYGVDHPQCNIPNCEIYLDNEDSLDYGVCVFCRKERRWRMEDAWRRFEEEEEE